MRKENSHGLLMAYTVFDLLLYPPASNQAAGGFFNSSPARSRRYYSHGHKTATPDNQFARRFMRPDRYGIDRFILPPVRSLVLPQNDARAEAATRARVCAVRACPYRDGMSSITGQSSSKNTPSNTKYNFFRQCLCGLWVFEVLFFNMSAKSVI